jgi:hypothetical protein
MNTYQQNQLSLTDRILAEEYQRTQDYLANQQYTYEDLLNYINADKDITDEDLAAWDELYAGSGLSAEQQTRLNTYGKIQQGNQAVDRKTENQANHGALIESFMTNEETTLETKRKILETNKDYISESDYEMFSHYLDTLECVPAYKAADEEMAKQEAEALTPKQYTTYSGDSNMRIDVTGDNFSITVGDTTYNNLEVGSTIASDIRAKTDFVPNNSIFLYKGNVYIKTASDIRQIGGSGTFGVNNDGNSDGKRSLNNLKAALKSGGYEIV